MNLRILSGLRRLDRPWYITAGLALGIFCGYSIVALERDAGASESSTPPHYTDQTEEPQPLQELHFCGELNATGLLD